MGRQGKGSRVTYLLSPDGSGKERVVPEAVVLKRWRRRKMRGHTFSGSRLSSTVWRAVAHAFPDFLQGAEVPPVDEIRARAEVSQVALKRLHLSLPSAEILNMLFLDLGSERLRRLVERHTADAHKGKSGVPDLYLFAHTQSSPERPAFSRFVEVKKPEEPVSKSQQEEIAFMHGLGLQTRVLRLIER